MRTDATMIAIATSAAVLLVECGGDKSADVRMPPPPVIHWDSTFVDGDVSLGEPFFDLNNNRKWDGPGVLIDFPRGEPFVDQSSDGEYQGPDDPWQPGIRFVDFWRNGYRDGVFDDPDSIKQDGEPNYFLCVFGTLSSPTRYDCLSSNQPYCIPAIASSQDDRMWVTVSPNGFMSFEHGLVCWIPEGEGMQDVTIIVRDSYWQADTLHLTVYISH